MVSDILDPVIELVKDGREVISTEDLLAQIEILNEKLKNWDRGSFWAGMKEEDMVACEVCVGSDNPNYTRDSPELCACGIDDGINEDGRIVTTKSYLGWVRRQNWERMVGWDDKDLYRTFSSSEVLPEDLQDQTVPMVIVGSDVVQLYPNLDIDKVVDVVEKAVMETTLEWEEVDLMEGCRYVALNWTEEQCRASGLRRVLPTRRYTSGCRPGLRGSGPQGGERGDTEQWDFPTGGQTNQA